MGRLARLAARLRGEHGGINVTIGSASAVVVAVVAIGAGAIVIPAVTGGSGFSCDRTAATASALGTQFAAATAGQTICLTAAINYGDFTGGTKASPGVTITPNSGIAATMAILYNGATNITVDGTLGGGTGDNHRVTIIYGRLRQPQKLSGVQARPRGSGSTSSSTSWFGSAGLRRSGGR